MGEAAEGRLYTTVEETIAFQKSCTENLLMLYESCLEVRPHVRVSLGIYTIIYSQETPRFGAYG